MISQRSTILIKGQNLIHWNYVDEKEILLWLLQNQMLPHDMEILSVGRKTITRKICSHCKQGPGMKFGTHRSISYFAFLLGTTTFLQNSSNCQSAPVELCHIHGVRFCPHLFEGNKRSWFHLRWWDVSWSGSQSSGWEDWFDINVGFPLVIRTGPAFWSYVCRNDS